TNSANRIGAKVCTLPATPVTSKCHMVGVQLYGSDRRRLRINEGHMKSTGLDFSTRAGGILVLAAALGVASYCETGEASARVYTHARADDISDTKTFVVWVISDSWSDYTWEERLAFECEPNGHVSVTWYTGGRFSGSPQTASAYMPTFYRFDGG